MTAIPSREFFVRQAILNAAEKRSPGNAIGWLKAFISCCNDYQNFGEGWLDRDVHEQFFKLAAQYSQ